MKCNSLIHHLLGMFVLPLLLLFSTSESQGNSAKVISCELNSDELKRLFLISGSSQSDIQAVEEGLRIFVERAAKNMGCANVKSRLQVLAAQSHAMPGKIKIQISGGESYNVLSGLPYTTVQLADPKQATRKGMESQPPNLKDATLHEFSHLFFGNTRALLAEPFADLAVRGPRPAATDPCSIVALATLQAQPNSQFARDFSIQSLMNTRTTPWRKYCEVLERDGHERARQWAADCLRSASLSRELPPGCPSRAESPEHHSPNETNGPPREVMACLGDSLQSFMMDRFGFEGYLEFFYRPTAETLRRISMGNITSLEDLNRSVGEYLNAELRKNCTNLQMPTKLTNELAKLSQTLSGHECLRKQNWYDCKTSTARDLFQVLDKTRLSGLLCRPTQRNRTDRTQIEKELPKTPPTIDLARYLGNGTPAQDRSLYCENQSSATIDIETEAATTPEN